MRESNFKSPFFSVIICTFNRAALLNRALDSLLHQPESDWEAIIIDDGSTDNTKEILNKYLEQNQNIKYFFQENHGSGYSKNEGLKQSSGRYISFLDSDDEYLHEHLTSRKKILLENSTIDLLYGGAKIIGNPYVPDFENPGKQIHLDNCIIGGTLFIKREMALKIGGFSALRFGEDYEFFQRAIKHNFKIMKTEEPTYVYHRDGDDSLCDSKKKINFFLD
ncbi:MAG: glycosyltransferase family 2 protein [Bacteroidetes bacterium]|nr:MAG: glycosyltransferase family 2 protein [Bacteroidota bacterium]